MGRWLMVSGSRNLAHYDEPRGHIRALVVVEERMPGFGIFFDIVIDADRRQRPLQPVGGSAQRTVLRTKTSYDGTCSGQETVGILRDGAVIDAGCRESVAGRQQQCKSAAHAETDHADFASAARLPR